MRVCVCVCVCVVTESYEKVNQCGCYREATKPYYEADTDPDKPPAYAPGSAEMIQVKLQTDRLAHTQALYMHWYACVHALFSLSLSLSLFVCVCVCVCVFCVCVCVCVRVCVCVIQELPTYLMAPRRCQLFCQAHLECEHFSSRWNRCFLWKKVTRWIEESDLPDLAGPKFCPRDKLSK